MNHIDFHPHYEMYFCPNRIEQTVIVNGEEKIIDTPNVIITSPYSAHVMLAKSSSCEAFERHVVYFDERIFDGVNRTLFSKELISKDGNVAFYLSNEEAEELMRIVHAWHTKNISQNERLMYFSAFLLALDRIVPRDRREQLDSSRSEIPSILEFINRNIKEDLRIERITREFGVSRSTLDRDFRKILGRSFHQTVIDCRISAAIRMLKYTNMPIKDIAAECGLDSEYYFYSFIKRNLGDTPNNIRKISKKIT